LLLRASLATREKKSIGNNKGKLAIQQT
jgi:hypothetical protein